MVLNRTVGGIYGIQNAPVGTDRNNGNNQGLINGRERVTGNAVAIEGSNRSDRKIVPSHVITGLLTRVHVPLTNGDNRAEDSDITNIKTYGSLADSNDSIATENVIKDYIDEGFLPIIGLNGEINSYAELLVDFPPVVGYRGWLAVVMSATGTPDSIYMCLKSGADTYNWIEFINAGLV